MPAFDPNNPVNGVLIDANFLRGQFNSLKELIDALPAITSAQVDAVNTLPPGDAASAGISISGSTLHLSFGIPAGQSGPPGEVTTPQMDAAISSALATAIQGTAQNPTSVQPINGAFADPDVNAVREKLNELIAALFRAP